MQVGGFFQNPSLNPYMSGNFEAAAISLPDQIAQLDPSSMPALTDAGIEQMNKFDRKQNRKNAGLKLKGQFKESGQNMKNALSGKGGGNAAAFGMLQQGFGMANNYLNKDLVNSEGFDTFNKVADGVVSTLGAINPAWGAIAGAVQTGINGINAAGATKSDSFSVDAQTQSQMGSGYIGSYDDMAKASQKAGKKYGLFNRKGFKQAQEDITKSQQMQSTIQDINEENQSRLAMAANTQMNAMNYANKLNGGIDFNNMRIGRLGFKLENLDRCRKIKTTHIVNVDTKRIEEFKPVIPESTKLFKKGGSIEKEWKPLFIYQEEVPQMKNGGETKQKKSRTIDELIEYAKQQNPRFIQRMSEPVKSLDLGNGEKGTHMMGWATDDNGNAIVYSQIQENDKGNLFDYGDAALDRALKNKNYLIMTPEEAKLFTESDEDYEGNLFGYKRGWPEFFKVNYDFSQDGDYFDNEDPKTVEAYRHFKQTLPANQRLTPESKYRSYLYWKSWGQPKDFSEAKTLRDGENEMYHFDTTDNGYHGTSVAWLDGIGYFTKPNDHDTVKYELNYYNDAIMTEEGGKQRKLTGKELEDWQDFKNRYDLVEDGNFYKYVPKTKKHKEGGSIKESDELVKLEETNQKNVIPEGALHKNKHHIEHTEEYTQKGIPVVDNDGEQQAEVELNEIIFTLEVTKKLEELHKIYKEGNKSDQDKAAVEAGKLLVQEILYNTIDRTGLISKCENGGKL